MITQTGDADAPGRFCASPGVQHSSRRETARQTVACGGNGIAATAKRRSRQRDNHMNYNVICQANRKFAQHRLSPRSALTSDRADGYYQRASGITVLRAARWTQAKRVPWGNFPAGDTGRGSQRNSNFLQEWISGNED